VRRTLTRLALLTALAAPSLPVRAWAQFGAFGLNKIQYRHFDWHVLHGAHVDLYCYPEEEELARVALAYAEESYQVLAVRFRHSIAARIPLIVYASHQDFEQTNVLPFVPPEGLLGVTEFLKDRVAVPFTGSYAEFRHSLRHEMVHVFQLSRLALAYTLYPRQRGVEMPLWWQEGLAEYWSAGEDSRDYMILRDLTVEARLPTIEELGGASGGIVYPLGGTLVRFLATRYGDWRIVQLYDDVWKYPDFAALVRGVFGRTLEQLTAEWQYDMRRRFYPTVTAQRPLELDARRIATLAIKPVVWTEPYDSTPQVLYLSPRTGYTDIYAVPLAGGRARTVVKGERTPEFESFHPFESRLDVSSKGVVVFASKYQDRDALFFWDLARQQIVGRYQFPGLVSILSPGWSPDGREVVFSGLSFSGYSDLYLLHLDTGMLERLTADRYQDLDPSFAPDGRRVVFASDRTAFGATGAQNLFVMDLATRAIRYLTYGDWRDEGPRWSAATGRISFTSDRLGTFDVYSVDSGGAGRRETAVPGGAFDAEWVPSAGRYVVAGFEHLTFGIYSVRPQPDSGAAGVVALAANPASASWSWPELADSAASVAEAARYREHYTVDFAAGGAVYSPGYLSAQGAAILFSDMLSDHQVYVSAMTFQEGTSVGSLVNDINATAVYLDQTQRLNWGVGAFRTRGLFYTSDLNQVFEESSYGGLVELRYPLSRFSRVETQFRMAYSDRTDFTFQTDPFTPGFPHRRGLVTSNYLSYVHDNSLWLDTGPIDGSFSQLTAGVVNDLQNARFDSWLVEADLRHYLRTSLHTAVALRGFAFYSGGERPERVTIGGSWALRGYPQYSYLAGDRALMANVEWRFPITHYLSIGSPLGEIRFPGVQGALFSDLGRAWSEQATERGWLGAYGLGLRMSLFGPLILRLDMGWRYGLGNVDAYQLPPNYPVNTSGNGFVAFWFGYDY
jgi:Tol biopolymer transport system component